MSHSNLTATLNAASEPAPQGALASLAPALFAVGESVDQLRWLSMALVSARLEAIESVLDVEVLLRECLAKVHPPLPDRCESTLAVQPGLGVHADPTLLAEALGLLLNAASLRLHFTDQCKPESRPKLNLHARARGENASIHVVYNVKRTEPVEALGHEELAFKIIQSMGGQVRLRTTRRWTMIRVRLPSG